MIRGDAGALSFGVRKITALVETDPKVAADIAMLKGMLGGSE